jgi:hypothetical protein
MHHCWGELTIFLKNMNYLVRLGGFVVGVAIKHRTKTLEVKPDELGAVLSVLARFCWRLAEDDAQGNKSQTSG